MDKVVITMSVITALSTALVAGVLFAFSNTFMKALGKLPTAQGVMAFQVTNTTILNPLFLLLFVGTGVLSLALAVLSVVRWSQPGSVFLLIGSLLYIVGVIVETRIIHLPRNDALDKADPNSARAAELWADMLATWTTWNHVRVVAALLAATSFIIAAVRA